MPMTDEEAGQVFVTLADGLRQQRLDWVVEQVEEEIDHGKSDSQRLSTYKRTEEKLALPLDTEGGFTKKGKAEFATLTDYSAPEQLAMLLDAIEQAVVNTALMEQAIRDTLEGKVEFAQYDVSETIVFPSDGFAERSTAAEQLRQLLDELRQELER